MNAPVVGVDLGGTKIFGALVDGLDSGSPRVLEVEKRATPTTSSDDVIAAIVEVVKALDPAPDAVGIGTPGVVAPDSGVVLRAPNLPGFDGPVRLGALLSERLGTEVSVGNDVNVAALGEARAGAARGHDDVLAVWLGTGLGAGLILDGRLRVGPSGLAGELGHTVVVPGGRRCGCGGRGHLEAYIGRRALEDEARARHAAGEATVLVERAGKKRIKSKAFKAAYDEGDTVTVDLIDNGLEMLAVAVANAITTIDIAAVVVGGGLGERFGGLAVERLTTRLDTLRFAGPPPTVVEATLGDDAGAIGAAILAAESR